MTRVRVAVVSPLPPSPSGVADYAARLNRELEREFEVTACESVRAGQFPPCDVALYHIGNNRLHAGAYRAAIERPGIVVLHDAVLHHFYLGHLGREDYIDEFVYNEGEWFRDRAAVYWRESGAAESDERYFRYPMLRRIVERSQAVIVHNRKALRMVEEAAAALAQGLRIFEIPHFVEPPPVVDSGRAAETRRKLGIPEEAVVIGCLGYLRPSKRVGTLLDAARSLDGRCALLLAGEFTSSDYGKSILRRAGTIPLVRVPHLPEAQWLDMASIVDICVNLRYPSAGETSGIVMRMMAMGKPVLVTRGEEVAGLPEHTVIKVDDGDVEVELLSELLRVLAKDADLRESIGTAAREHVLAYHSIEGVVEKYVEVIREVASMRE